MKKWINQFNFGIFHIKIRLYSNFHKNGPIFKAFWVIKAKTGKEDKKIWKNDFDI